MNVSQYSLEDWTAKVSASSKKKIRTLVARFQKHWYEGHLSNPLLFPMEQTHQAWKEHLDWYLTVEKFQMPDKKITPAPATEPVAVDPETPPTPETAETIFFNAEPAGSEGKTVIYEPSNFAAGEADGLDELNDLGTLIVEHKQKKQKESPKPCRGSGDRPAVPDDKTVIVDTPSGKLQPESNLETVITTAKTPPAAGQDETTIIDSVSSAPSLEETDLSTLIDETDREKAGPVDRTDISPGQGTVESGGAETVIYGPKEQDREGTLSPDQGTLITSYPADQAPQGQPPRSFPVHEEKKPGSPAKGPSKKIVQDVELDLEDLDTMEWMDSED